MNKRPSIFFITLLTILLLNPASCYIQTYYTGQTSADLVFQQEVWVDVDKDDYYSYEVYSQDGTIIVQILDQNEKVWKLEFSKSPNTLIFLDAYYKFIVVEERKPGATVAYWFIQIVQKNDCFSLDAFAASSRIDNQGFDFSFGFQITEIIEYDEESTNLYVHLASSTAVDIYYVTVCERSSIMKIVGWFDYNQKCQQSILFGNSRVLVEANNNEFWIDSNNTRKGDQDPTIYYKKPIAKYTDKTIYPGGSRTFNLADWYFQYVSESSDHCRLTAFVVSGYVPVASPSYTMTSSSPFKYYGDGYNFFIAVSSNDVYLTNLYENRWGKYELWSGLLSNECKDAKTRTDIYNDFNTAKIIVYHDGHFYMLTDTSYVVYGGCHSYFIKIYEQDLTAALTCADDLENVLQGYMNSCKGKWVAHNDYDDKYDNKYYNKYDNKKDNKYDNKNDVKYDNYDKNKLRH